MAVVAPGTALDRQLAGRELMFGAKPATYRRRALGGVIGTNSCGSPTQASGKTVDHVVRLEVLTVDGTYADTELMKKTGIRADRLGSGCCRLARNFRFGAGHDAVSCAAGERVLLSRVRQPDLATAPAGWRFQLPHADRAGRHRTHPRPPRRRTSNPQPTVQRSTKPAVTSLP
ncbi:MAG: FAD-binding protein [Lapillicoccus sp.]